MHDWRLKIIIDGMFLFLAFSSVELQSRAHFTQVGWLETMHNCNLILTCFSQSNRDQQECERLHAKQARSVPIVFLPSLILVCECRSLSSTATISAKLCWWLVCCRSHRNTVTDLIHSFIVCVQLVRQWSVQLLVSSKSVIELTRDKFMDISHLVTACF